MTVEIRNLNGKIIYTHSLDRADLRGADLRGADLRGADLRGADLRGTNLGRANLEGANLIGADLTGADFTGAIFDGADLQKTGITREQLVDACASLDNYTMFDELAGGEDVDAYLICPTCGQNIPEEQFRSSILDKIDGLLTQEELSYLGL